MASRTRNEAFLAVSDLKVWYNNRSGGDLTLADVSEIISLRWPYFRDNWAFIRDSVVDRVDNYQFPDSLREQITELTIFIDQQKNSGNQNVNPFSSGDVFTRFYAVWDNIFVNTISLTREEQVIIENKLVRIARFIRTDFETLRTTITAARDEIADTIGLQDDDYNIVTQRSSVTTLRDPKISDITRMQTFQTSIKSINYVLANSNRLNTSTVDPFALARANANNPEIEVATGRSTRLVRMNFGDNLQTLADRYFGNVDRWIEIAIANGLKPPYVDEIGEAILLLSNGEDNKLNISPIDAGGNANINKFYIDQPVFLQSDTLKFPEQRQILNITEIPISGEIILELDGESDLSKYKTTDNTTVRIYKPNTVNSNFFVAIPSNVELDEVQVGETPFFLESSSEDEKKAGVDLLVDGDNDLAFGSSGDLQLSFGLSNALQAMRFKILSERGQSKRHPNFGLPSVMGEKKRDPEQIHNTLIDGINEMIDADVRFDRIEQIEVAENENGDTQIGLVVRLAGTGTLLPLSFKLNVN
jgi:hypothetical protein